AGDGGCGGAGGRSGDGSRVRADGTRVPPMLVLPLSAVRDRLPEFDEGLAIPVSQVPRDAAVVWVSHCWGGTPARPDDQGNTKAKAIYEGLKNLDRGDVYVWVDVSCLPHNARPAGGMESISAASKGLAVAEAVAFSDSEMVQTEAQVIEDLGQRARTIRALPLFLLCCDYFLSVDDREPIYMCSPWTRLERAALREALTLTSGGGATKTTRAGHPRMLRMLRDETVSYMGLSKRATAVVSHLSNLSMLPRLEMLPPFGPGSKAGASGIWAADVPAMKRSYELLEGLSLARAKLARYPCMDVPRLVPDEEAGDTPIEYVEDEAPQTAGAATEGTAPVTAIVETAAAEEAAREESAGVVVAAFSAAAAAAGSPVAAGDAVEKKSGDTPRSSSPPPPSPPLRLDQPQQEQKRRDPEPSAGSRYGITALSPTSPGSSGDGYFDVNRRNVAAAMTTAFIAGSSRASSFNYDQPQQPAVKPSSGDLKGAAAVAAALPSLETLAPRGQHAVDAAATATPGGVAAARERIIAAGRSKTRRISRGARSSSRRSFTSDSDDLDSSLSPTGGGGGGGIGSSGGGAGGAGSIGVSLGGARGSQRW
ncbi:unnamed protein product, partial [Scytosiphon promiscuus]